MPPLQAQSLHAVTPLPSQSTQVELVLLIFRRLAEDIHGYESGMTSGRKREMAAALNQQSQTVFTFLISNLEVITCILVLNLAFMRNDLYLFSTRPL